jgi:hypothetical protein
LLRHNRSLHEDIVTGITIVDILARAADQDVGSGAAVECIIAGAADQDVVAVIAIRDGAAHIQARLASPSRGAITSVT